VPIVAGERPLFTEKKLRTRPGSGAALSLCRKEESMLPIWAKKKQGAFALLISQSPGT